MMPLESAATKKRGFFELTRYQGPDRGSRIARGAIIIYGTVLLTSGFVACSCPGFFVIMAVCAVVAMFHGTRFQRILSGGLLLLAVVGFGIQLQQEMEQKQRLSERVRNLRENNRQHPRAQPSGVPIP